MKSTAFMQWDKPVLIVKFPPTVRIIKLYLQITFRQKRHLPKSPRLRSI